MTRLTNVTDDNVTDEVLRAALQQRFANYVFTINHGIGIYVEWTGNMRESAAVCSTSRTAMIAFIDGFQQGRSSVEDLL